MGPVGTGDWGLGLGLDNNAFVLIDIFLGIFRRLIFQLFYIQGSVIHLIIVTKILLNFSWGYEWV